MHKLYAVPHSLYAGKVRAYLIKNRIGFHEISPSHESFRNEVLPESKILTLPILVTPSGEVIRDGAAILAHFEAANDRAFEPRQPQQQIVSALFDLVGVEGLRRPA
ncbi:MAG: glutathione S-transferase N-terminal domain-containing protein, partial [Pseudomonadota bacterium]